MSSYSDVVKHYGTNSLVANLETALREAGLAGRQLTPIDLAPLDQFHARGLAATVELSEAARVQQFDRVIDVGSGLGGPSRYLAASCGCRVSGVDLSPSFVEAATYLAKRCGLADRVDYRSADALSLPFGNGEFDLAWTQHVAMNIADRDRLYAEVYRVLRPGGRFAAYDIVAGEAAPVIHPVPWARGHETSFLLAPATMRTTLERQGFKAVSWDHREQQAIAWFDQQQSTGGLQSRSTLGLHLAMGPDFREMAANLERNLREGRIGLIQAVLERL
jgi:SAM-dependent methyltransferase